MRERERLEQAIAAQESLRGLLPDETIDSMIATLQEKLDAVEAHPVEQRRKQVSVLFADVPGVAVLSQTIDAEEVTGLVNELWQRLDVIIRGYHGYIDKHMSGAVMALWGTQQASEDDPEQAVRAALEMQAAMAAFRQEYKVDFAMRIGINTGPVLLGEVGSTREFTALGDTVNTASRLQDAASLGSVLISHDTYRHLRGVFSVQLLEPLQVKGKSEPVQAYQVLFARPRAFRLGKRGVEGIETRMVGRQAELEQLQQALGAVMQGAERRTLTVSGEAGVGKSRLLYEFETWIDLYSNPVLYFKGRAYPTSQSQPYALLRNLFAFRFEILEDDPAEVVRRKVEQGIALYLGEGEQGRLRAHFIGQLLGFDFSASAYILPLGNDAQQLRDRARQYLAEYFRSAASDLPVVLFLEDLHWADDSSLDLMAYLANNLAGSPVLMVGLARPALFERRQDWCSLPEHFCLQLNPLTRQDASRLVEDILQKVEDLPSSLRDLVVNVSDGNPFFVEELIKMLIEDRVILVEPQDDAPWRVSPERLASVRVPPTLTGVLQARLDSLQKDERTLLQQAAVIGRIFWESALGRLCAFAGQPCDGQALGSLLEHLQQREMIFQRSISAFHGTREFIFKHALLREVAYESVLKRQRQAYHRLVAEWLIEHSASRPEEYLGEIAEHLERAAQREQAADYLCRAGEQAVRRYANLEAVQYFSRALALLPRGQEASRFQLLLKREAVLDLLGKRPEQAADLTALKALAANLPDQQGEVALRQAKFASITGDYALGIEAAQAALAFAQALSDLACQADAHIHWGRMLFYQNELEGSEEHLAQGIQLAQTSDRPDLQAVGLRFLGGLAYRRGDLAAAHTFTEQSLKFCRRAATSRAEAAALSNLGMYSAAQGDYDRAQAYFERSLALARQIGASQQEGFVLSTLGTLRSELGDFDTAVALLEQAVSIQQQNSDRNSLAATLSTLGWVALAQGEYNRARALYEQGLSISQQIGDASLTAVTQTSLGLALAGLNELEAAEANIQAAIAMRRQTGPPLFLMEALCALAGVYLACQDAEAALTILGEVFAYLESGGNFDGSMFDLANFLICYQALQARQDPRAETWLQMAYTRLQARADQIADLASRRMFLENIPWHREIIRRRQARSESQL